MQLWPWDFLGPGGRLRPEAAEAEGLLLWALELEPQHPLALHLHVHLAELGNRQEELARPGPTAGERSADALRGRFPRMAHLLHMPSHLYIR